MEFITVKDWNEALWKQAEPVYEEAFPEHGRKSRLIVKRMLEQGIGMLHIWKQGEETAAMALSGIDRSRNILVLDYIAVRKTSRGNGLGLACLDDIRRYAKEEAGCRAIVIEVEAEPSEENERRIRFWEKAGFTLTDYVKSYIWVPETYRAMFLSLDKDIQPVPDDGKEWFKSILKYHEQAYRNRGK